MSHSSTSAGISSSSSTLPPSGEAPNSGPRGVHASSLDYSAGADSSSISAAQITSVYSWGRGEDGQLGIGDTSDQSTPTAIALPVHIASLSCGSGHTVVLSTTGAVYTWGRGDDGRLGHGDNGWKYIPRPVSSLANTCINIITCGSYHTAAVDSVGNLYTWGGGMYGKLGHGGETGHSTPTRVAFPVAASVVTAVACGSRHTVALVCSGGGDAGNGNTNGDVYTWGDKENGVSGHAEYEGHQYTPRKIDRLANVNMVGISACGFHTAALADSGEVWTWGEGKFGRLGHGSERNVPHPKLVEAMSGIKAVKIACGGFHTAAITEQGTVYTWGGGEHGQLGLGDKINKTVPTPITTMDSYQIASITCGWSHTVALSSCGKVFTWGNGDHGKLGHGTTAKVAVPKLVESLAHLRVIKIASYNEHTAALCHAGLGFSHGSGQTVSRDFVLNMKEMLDNEEFSDIAFRVEGRLIHAHKNILASRCAHFRAMFASGMRESVESEILIPTTSYSVFMSLLEFLYTDNIDNLGAEDAILLFSAADLYNLDRLKDMTAVVVRRSINPDNATRLLQIAHDAHALAIKEICLQFVVTKFDTISKSEAIQGMSHGLLIECLQMRP